NLFALSREPFDLTLREDFGKKPNVLTMPAGKRQDGLFEAVISLATFPRFSSFQAKFADKQATVALGYTLTGESAVHPLAPQHLLSTGAPKNGASTITPIPPSAFITGD